MNDTLVVVCAICKEVVACYVKGIKLYCWQCPQCILCTNRLDNPIATGLCQRHLQEVMDANLKKVSREAQRNIAEKNKKQRHFLLSTV